MDRWPVDAPRDRVLRELAALGFEVVREREHLALLRTHPDGSRTPMTLPNHPRLKGSTLRAACRQGRIERDAFLAAYEEA